MAEDMVAAEGDLDASESDAVVELDLGGAHIPEADESGPIGEEGQTGERQHTSEPEPPAVQSGQNYTHEQVEVDAQTATRAPDAQPENAAAGEPGIANAGGLFAILNNPAVELEQLERQDVSADQIEVVQVSDLLTDAGLESFRASLEETGQQTSSPWEAAHGHYAIGGAIEEADASMEDVVAIDVLDEGVVVYTYSR